MNRVLKAACRSVGLEVSRIDREGVDPFIDLQKLVPRPSVIFDVGANVGQSALRFRRLFPDATIYSFEPGRNAFESLRNVAERDRSVYAWNLGLGESDGREAFYESSESALSSFLPPGEDSWQTSSRKTEVEMSTLDSFCGERSINCIDILKTDTQGYDLNVLRGSSRIMGDSKIGAVLIEINFDQIYAGQGSAGQIFEYLSTSRFHLFSIYQIFRRNGWAAWTDALFIHESFRRTS